MARVSPEGQRSFWESKEKIEALEEYTNQNLCFLLTDLKHHLQTSVTL